MKTLLTITLILWATTAQCKRLMPEADYQEYWCQKNKGLIEVVLKNRSRIDCLTETHAIEFDFADKRDQAIGQSLRYAIATEKRAGIVLIIEKPSHEKYWLELNNTIKHYSLPIDLFRITPKYIQKTQEK